MDLEEKISKKEQEYRFLCPFLGEKALKWPKTPYRAIFIGRPKKTYFNLISRTRRRIVTPKYV